MERFWIRKLKSIFSLLGVLGLCFLPVATLAFSPPESFTYQGRIIKPDGYPLEADFVTFTLQIRSPGTEGCILYEETQSINMTGSDGVFSLRVGQGSRSINDPGLGFMDVFSNLSVKSSLYCDTGTSYAPASGHARKLRVTFNDGTETVALSPDHVIQSVPFASQAHQIDGKGVADFIQVNTATSQVSQSNIENVFNSYSELMSLLDGTSTQYATSSGGNFTPTSPVDFNTQKITNLGAPSLGSDAVNKTYSDSTLAGNTIDVSGLSDGQSVRWNQSLMQWEVYTPADLSQAVWRSGDTMAGHLSMAGTYLITDLPQPSLSDDASNKGYVDSTVAGISLPVVGPASGESLRYNGTSWDYYTPRSGTVTSVSATGPLSVTNPSTTPTVSLSLASSSTDGYLSSTDWSAFNNKFSRSQLPATPCTASQVLSWTSVTDTLSCADISITKAQITDFPTLGSAASKNAGTSSGDVLLLDASGQMPTSALPATLGQWIKGSGTDIYYSDKVGIGTSAPSHRLTVAGSAQIESGTTDDSITWAATYLRKRSDSISPSGGFGTGIGFLLEGSTDSSFAQSGQIINFWEVAQSNDTTDRDSALAFSTSLDGTMTETMRLTSKGYLGVGTIAPSDHLHVLADSAGSVVSFDNSTSGSYLTLKTAGVPRGYLSWDMTLSGAAGGSHLHLQNDVAGGSLQLITRQPDGTRNSTALVVNSAGNVGIGTESPNASLQVNGSLRANNIYATGATRIPIHTYFHGRAEFPHASATALCPSPSRAIYVPERFMGKTGSEICAEDNASDGARTTCAAVKFAYLTVEGGSGSNAPNDLTCADAVDVPWPWVSSNQANSRPDEWISNTYVVCCQ